jgi:hypothetical protein
LSEVKTADATALEQNRHKWRMTMDITHTIVPKSDQLNADSFMGGPKTYTVAKVTANEGSADQPINIYFEGEPLVFRPCKSMRRVIVKIWGPDASKYAGRGMTLYRDPKVKWGGMEVGGIRISHMSGLEKAEVMALTETRAQRKPYTVQPLKIEAAKPKVDKAAQVAAAIIERIADAMDVGEVENDPKVIEQRAWLVKNRPELAEQVDAAFNNISEGAE